MPLRYIAKNSKFAYFPSFSATFNTLLISLYYRDDKNASTGLILACFHSLVVLFSFYNVHFTLNMSVFLPIVAGNGESPPIPANKGSATEKFKFLVF